MSNMGEGPFARFARIRHPVARDEDLLVEHLADETVVYDNKTKEAHCLSPLAAVVFAHCDGRTTVEQLAAQAADRLGEPVDETRVIDALAQLQERDLLSVPPRDGLSRRQMIGKTAAAAGGAFVGASLITTIIAPPAIAASSAACGQFTCCPCCASTDAGKKACCHADVLTQCNCVNASNPSSNNKYCMPAAFENPQLCENLNPQKTNLDCDTPATCNCT